MLPYQMYTDYKYVTMLLYEKCILQIITRCKLKVIINMQHIFYRDNEFKIHWPISNGLFMIYGRSGYRG